MQTEKGMNIIIDLINHTLNTIKPQVDTMPDMLDYDTVSESFIPALASAIGYNYRHVDDRAYHNDLIRSMLKVYNFRGTDYDVIQASDNFDNLGWLGGDYYYPDHWKQDNATTITDNIDKIFIHSKSKHYSGDRFKDG